MPYYPPPIAAGSADGGSAYIVVAAADAPAAVRARADLVCSGSGDQAQILTALADGAVQLSRGTFQLSAPVVMQLGNTSLFGTGQGTILRANTGFVGTEVVRVRRDDDAQPVPRVTLGNFQVDGNSIAGVSGVHYRSFQGLIHYVTAYNCPGDGFQVRGYSAAELGNANGWSTYDTRLVLCFSRNNGGAGYVIGTNGADLHIIDCLGIDNTLDGIRFDGGAGGQIRGGHFYANLRNGLYTNGVGGTRIQVENTRFESSGQRNIFVDGTSGITFDDVRVRNGSTQATGTYANVYINGTGVSWSGGASWADTESVSNPSYAFELGSGASAARIKNARTSSASEYAVGILLNGSPSSNPAIIRGVQNVRDQGQRNNNATITSGNTSVTVTFPIALAAAPNADQIKVNLINSSAPTNAIGEVRVINVTTTNFQIAVRNDPGTSGATFAWAVDL